MSQKKDVSTFHFDIQLVCCVIMFDVACYVDSPNLNSPKSSNEITD